MSDNQKRFRKIRKVSRHKTARDNRIDRTLVTDLISRASNISRGTVAIAAFLAAIVAIATNINQIKKTFFPQPALTSHILGSEYWRLTGAYEIPFFLDEGPKIAQCSETTAAPGTDQDCELNDSIGKIWRTELNNTVIRETRVADFSDPLMGVRELWESSYESSGNDELFCTIISMDGGLELDVDPKNVIIDDAIIAYLGEEYLSGKRREPVGEQHVRAFENGDACAGEKHSKKIGFLLLRLQNFTDTNISNLTISYKEFRSDGAHPSNRLVSDILLADMTSLVPVSVENWANRSKQKQVTKAIQNAPQHEEFVRSLGPGESILIPIYIYRARADMFEDYFYKNWRLPIKISFEFDGTRYSLDAPLPHRHEAAVIATYEGWYQQ